GEEELIPGQRVAPGQLVMEVPSNLLSPGYYSVLRPEGDTLTNLAFNLDVRESRLLAVAPEKLEGQFTGAPVEVLVWEGIDEFQQQLQALQEGNSYWRLALWLTLLFLGAEIALIRFL
ncbi:MAG TPA: hypothetical protein DCR93_02860, partial [Cytophagales bacterium]|nr:hypothetical protein [Cytophagales bacterium]